MNKILNMFIGVFITLALSGCGASAGFDAQAQQDYAAAVKQQAQNGATAISGAVEIAKAEQAQNAEVLRTTQAQNAQLQAQNAALSAKASSAWVDGLTLGALGAGVLCVVFMAGLWWVMNQRTQMQYQIVPQVQYMQAPITVEYALGFLIRSARDEPTRAVLRQLKAESVPQLEAAQ